MKRIFTLFALICCGTMVYGSPYGKALQKARQVAGKVERRSAQTEPGPQVRRNADDAVSEFKHLYVQLGMAARSSRGVLPGPAGVAGLKKLCGPGKVAPSLLKINDFGKLTEKNCPWAYVGGELGSFNALPKGGKFPILFSKAAPGVREIRVLFADGSVTKLDARHFRNSRSVVDFLRKSSPRAKHPAWNKIVKGAALIDRASR